MAFPPGRRGAANQSREPNSDWGHAGAEGCGGDVADYEPEADQQRRADRGPPSPFRSGHAVVLVPRAVR